MFKIIAITVLLFAVVYESKGNASNESELNKIEDKLERKPANQQPPEQPPQMERGNIQKYQYGRVVSHRFCTRTTQQFKANKDQTFIKRLSLNVSFTYPPGILCELTQFEPSVKTYTVLTEDGSLERITIEHIVPARVINNDGTETSITTGVVTTGICEGSTICIVNTYACGALQSCARNSISNSDRAIMVISGPPCYGACSGVTTFAF